MSDAESTRRTEAEEAVLEEVGFCAVSRAVTR